MNIKLEQPAKRPKSCNSFWVNHFSFALSAAYLTWVWVQRGAMNVESLGADLWKYLLPAVALFIIPQILYEIGVLKSHRRPSTGLDFNQKVPSLSQRLKRVSVKLLGLYITFTIIAFCYWLFPVYDDGSYQSAFFLAKLLLPWFVIASIPYFLWIDRKMTNPYDAYWHLGMIALQRRQTGWWSHLKPHLLGWLVKFFFLPLMVGFTAGNLYSLLSDRLAVRDFYGWYDYIVLIIFTADLLPAIAGYLFTFRLFDTHIRSTEPTVFGWVICLMCYPPFWSLLFFGQYLNYVDDANWSHMVGDGAMRWLWAGMIVTALVIYASATISLGIRFSNLTYRGLVTHGAYAFTKHPAYVMKNLSYWLINVPFLVHDDWQSALQQCCFLIGVNIIYYWRARTEERHLSNYPEYREYGHWMNQNGVLRALHKPFPWLAYKDERSDLSLESKTPHSGHLAVTKP